jgi:putative two-component system response regulator
MPPAPSDLAHRRSTILIVDDAAVDLTLLEALLQQDGHRVLAATSGSQALGRLADGPLPDLVVLDVHMPSMDGYEVLDRLRRRPTTAELPVIFHTGLGTPSDEAYGFARGAVDYIAKPAAPEVKLSRVRAQLAQGWRRRRLAVQALDLAAEVARNRHERDRLAADGLCAIAQLAALRDDDTGRHSLRTSRFVAALAARLRLRPHLHKLLTDEYIALLVRSTPLHDIGKVGIPDRILHKPGKLDAEEWTVMRSHTVIGADTIARAEAEADHAIPFLRIAKEMARSHHERWDGTGYPDRLAGPAIPLSARIMAVADVFDALTTTRPYKQPLPHDEARRIIVDGRGSHFDPDVVDGFVGCFDEFVAASHRFTEASPVQ